MSTNPIKKSYYEILGVPEDASQEEIKKARDRRVKEYHPDLQPNHLEWATERTKELNEAYETLKDETRRKGYDALLLSSPVAAVVPASHPEPPVWKTIRLGTGLKTADDFYNAIQEAGAYIDDRARDILDKPAFTVSNQSIELDLVMISVAELSFSDGATRQQIYDKARGLGLSLCPPEVGPQLRLQYMDQPKGEWLLVGAGPTIGSDGVPHVFNVERRGNMRWLWTCSAPPDFVWRGDHQWVFARRSVA